MKIKEYREKRGLKQYQLAEITGIDRATMSRLENGKQRLTAAQAEKISHALDVSVSVILDNESSKEAFKDYYSETFDEISAELIRDLLNCSGFDIDYYDSETEEFFLIDIVGNKKDYRLTKSQFIEIESILIRSVHYFDFELSKFLEKIDNSI